jgi:two-component sensor histidine kinase
MEKPRILAIDDTPANLMMLGSALSSHFDIQFATSGAAGLKLALTTPPALVLLDIMMPELDGFETCSLFKASPALKDTPVVFVTSRTDPGAEAKGLSLGAADYLTKPINVGIARQRISNLIERENLRKEVGRQRDAIQLALEEKAALLHELNNRVRGNLQIISSLLRLEAGQAQRPETFSVIGQMQGRVHCMALLQESLRPQGSSFAVDLRNYLERLSTVAFRVANRSGDAIRLRTKIESVIVDADQAATCGLLLNELISHCLSHEFPNGRGGGVFVGLKPDGDGVHVHVCANDVTDGLEKGFDGGLPASLQLQLAADLARQLGGKLDIQLDRGTRFIWRFDVAHGTEPDK